MPHSLKGQCQLCPHLTVLQECQHWARRGRTASGKHIRFGPQASPGEMAGLSSSSLHLRELWGHKGCMDRGGVGDSTLGLVLAKQEFSQQTTSLALFAFETGFCYIAQAVVKLAILLPQTPNSWEFRCSPLHPKKAFTWRERSEPQCVLSRIQDPIQLCHSVPLAYTWMLPENISLPGFCKSREKSLISQLPDSCLLVPRKSLREKGEQKSTCAGEQMTCC